MLAFLSSHASQLGARVSAFIREPLYRDLVTTRTFKRLEKVSFLGAIQWLWPQCDIQYRKNSRALHSIGVGLLAIEATSGVDAGRRKTTIAAALLHDIGHLPFSHSSEKYFRQQFGCDHKSIALSILRGENKDFCDIKNVLVRHNIDIDEVCSSFCEDALTLSNYLLMSPINVDTIDGILRSADFFGLAHPKISKSSLVDCLVHPEPSKSRVADHFWKLKDQVYREIYGPMGMAIEAAFDECLSSRGYVLRPADWSLTDAELLQKLRIQPEELKATFERRANRLEEEDLAAPRKFAINARVKLRAYRDFYGRYHDSRRRERPKRLAAA